MVDTSRILQKGPEYLRKQMEREREAPGRSAAERLAATKPEYIRNQQPPSAETGGGTCSSDQSEATPGSQTNMAENTDESSPHEGNAVKRNSSKKRPDSLLLYRQKGELQRSSSDGIVKKPIKRLLLSRRYKTSPFPQQELEETEWEAGSSQQLAPEANNHERDCEGVASQPATTVTNNREDVVRKLTTAVSTEREDIVRKPTTVVTNNREDFARKLTAMVMNIREDVARKPTTVVTNNREDVARKPTTVVTNNLQDAARKPTTVVTNNREDIAKKLITVVTSNRGDVARKPTTVVASNQEDVARIPTTAAASSQKDNAKNPTTVVMNIREHDLQDVTSSSERRRNRVSRSHSDISSRYSRSFGDFDTFFTYCGLDDDVIELVGRDNFGSCSEAPEEVFVSSGKVRSVSMATSDDGFSQTGSNRSDGLQEDELPDKKSGQGTSVIERNARIIKWLYSCRNAAQSGKTLRDLE